MEQLSELSFFKQRLSKIEPLLAIKQRHINSLLEITEAINFNMPILALIRIYESILLAQIGVQKILLIVKDEGDHWKCISSSSEQTQQLDINALVAQYQHLQYVTALNDPALEGFEYIIPVLHKKKPIGFSFIGNFASNELDTIEEKLKMIQTITNIILVANENKILFKNQMEQMLLQKELKVAADIQNLLIPSSLIDNEYVTAAAFYKPHKNVGGDYYDLIQTGENEIVFCICDISGKGVPAALLMANFQANLRAIVARGYNLDTTVTLLNKKVKEITQGEKFITLFIAKYNFSTRKLQYVNAGHNPPISIYKESVNLLDKGCTIIGMFDELPFLAVGEEMMPEGSKLICFTDGLTEASNESNELFELDRLITFIKDNNHLDVNQINADLVDRINLFKGENDFDDDLTLLSLCFH